MSLSEDQRALLQLLLDGDTYEQIAAVIGTTPSQVRARARDAFAELGRDDADEAEFADAVHDRLRVLDGQESALERSVMAPAVASRIRSPRRVALIGFAGAVAVLLFVFALIQTGGDSSNSTIAPQNNQEDVVTIKLAPVGGAHASGTATIVRVADLPAVDIELDGLAPNGPGETYVIWLLGSGGRGLPIAFHDIGPDGHFRGRTEIPSAAVGLLPNLDVIDVSLSRDREAAAAVNTAAQNSTLPRHVGTTVLRGALHG